MVMNNNIVRRNLLLKIISFASLHILKVYYFKLYRSAWDYDRLKFEWHLCGLSSINSVLFVGVHERSFVYQKAFTFDFCDVDPTYLLADSERFICKNCLDIEKEYDLVILSGVLNYGTDAFFFKEILNKKNFKAYLILDWLMSIKEHIWLSDDAYYSKLKRTFFYYYTSE